METCWFFPNKARDVQFGHTNWIWKVRRSQVQIFLGGFSAFSFFDVRYYRLMVRSGELCVIQRGMKFKVNRVNVIFRKSTYSPSCGHRSSFPMVPPVVVSHWIFPHESKNSRHSRNSIRSIGRQWSCQLSRLWNPSCIVWYRPEFMEKYVGFVTDQLPVY